MSLARTSKDQPQFPAYRWIKSALFALALLYAFAAGLRTLGDLDLDWQLATGRWIVQHRQIPFTDTFSYTAVGKEWIYPIVSQVFLYLTYAIGGYSLLSWLGAIACVSTVVLLLRRASPIGGLLAIISVPLIAACTPPRAEMFTAILFAAFVSLLWHYQRSGEGPLWLLPVLMVLWVNLHLGFIAGLAMCAAYVALELEEAIAPANRNAALFRLKSAAPWLIGTCFATLVNPWGWRIYAAIERQRSIAQTHSLWISEWQGLRLTWATFAKALEWRDPEGAVFWLMLAAAIAALVSLASRKIMPAVLLAGAIYVVVHAIRMEACFACLTVVVGGSVLADTMGAAGGLHFIREAVGARIGVFAAGGLLLLSGLLVALRVSDLVTNRYYLGTPYALSIFGAGNSLWQPEKAADFVLQEKLPRNLFHDFNSGGFVVWTLWPSYPDYIDGRSVPFGGDLLMRNSSLLEQPLDSEEWTKEADARGINTLLFSMDFEVGTALRSVGSYCGARNWRLVFLDAFGAVFVRVGPGTAGLIRRFEIDCKTVQFAGPSLAATRAEQFRHLLNVATILVVLDRNAEALQVLDKAEAIFTENAFLHYVKGIALGNVEMGADAEREFLRSIQLGSIDDAPAALARIYDQDGRFAEAARILNNAAEQSARPHWLYLTLGNVQLKLRRADLALTSFEKAGKWSPFLGDAYSLGAAFRAQVEAGKEQARNALAGK